MFVVTSGAGPGLVKEKTGFAIVDVEVVTVELEAVAVVVVLLAECETVVGPEERSQRSVAWSWPDCCSHSPLQYGESAGESRHFQATAWALSSSTLLVV